jgi:hypothetical protein
MENLALQYKLFDLIKNKLPNDENLAKTISNNLNVGIDAAYKKIKGERVLDLIELQLLLHIYRIPLSDVDVNDNYQKVWFQFRPIGENGFTYKEYLQQMMVNLENLIHQKVKHITYSAKEVPMFYNFMFPELGCFKSFVWQKSILNLPDFDDAKFSIHNLDPEIILSGNKVYQLYNQIHSKEIWNYETVNCTLRQIDFYKIAHLFENKESYDTILKQYNLLIQHIEKQTYAGKKIDFHTRAELADFDIYHNELILGDNTVLAQFETSQIAFITSQKEVTSYISKNIDAILKKSVRLNKQSEKIISPFFDIIKGAFPF